MKKLTRFRVEWYLHMTQNSIVAVRRASAGDASLLAELGARTFAEAFAADNTSEDMDAYLA